MHKYQLNTVKLGDLIKNKGHGSISEIARKIGLHRNTIGHFTSGHSVFPSSLVKIFDFLAVDGREYIDLKNDQQSTDTIAFVVDEILSKTSKCCVVLFGSRARGGNRKFSDFDLGLYSKDKIDHHTYASLIETVEVITEDFPFIVQLVNLKRAEDEFIKKISKDLIFLGGRMSDWISLKGKSHE